LEQYIEFKKGNLPLVISVPHGGTLECEAIPKRNEGVLGIDKGTINLARELIQALEKTFQTKYAQNKTASYVFSKVKRNKLDLNREEIEAFDKNSDLAKEIYLFYHGRINEIIQENIQSFGHSLLIDIHGFEKHKRPQGFRDVELILGTNNLKALYSNEVPKREWAFNIRGKIIKKCIKFDIPIAPGHPRRKEYVLQGGYIIQQYGAAKIARSQALQIEFSDRIRIHDEALKALIISILAELLFHEFA